MRHPTSKRRMTIWSCFYSRTCAIHRINTSLVLADEFSFSRHPLNPPQAAPAMPPTMRAVDIRDATGPATSLYINESTPKPDPEGTQALIKVKAFGLNRMG